PARSGPAPEPSATPPPAAELPWDRTADVKAAAGAGWHGEPAAAPPADRRLGLLGLVGVAVLAAAGIAYVVLYAPFHHRRAGPPRRSSRRGSRRTARRRRSPRSRKSRSRLSKMGARPPRPTSTSRAWTGCGAGRTARPSSSSPRPSPGTRSTRRPCSPAAPPT